MTVRAVSLTLAAGLAIGLAGATSAAAGPEVREPPAVQTWGFAIGSRTLAGDLARRYAGYELLVVDGQEARRRQVRTLRRGGSLVLGYVSVGTIERWRPWYRRLKRFRLGANRHWRGEYYAAVSRPGYRRQIVRRIAPRLLAKGFDGLFLDNVDMVETHRRQRRGMRRLVARLDPLVHQGGGLLFAQNGYSVITPMLRHLDGWNREDVTGTYDFERRRYAEQPRRRVAAAQRELRAVAAAGLLVTATDYTRRGRGAPVRRAVANACAAGALPYVSDIELRRTPSPPPSCP